MDYLAMLPEISKLPAVYVYRCIPCRRIETVVVKQDRLSGRPGRGTGMAT
jgi:hypothetical protein